MLWFTKYFSGMILRPLKQGKSLSAVFCQRNKSFAMDKERLNNLPGATLAEPLEDLKVVELAGLAPVPFCGLILADFGAEVTVVLKSSKEQFEQRLIRNKKIIYADLKNADGLQLIRKICLESDVLLDPFRPGVLEKIGLDPIGLLKENKKLIVARITGYGQTGEMSQMAGHDINYIAMSGLLPTIAGHSANRKSYWPPANLLADFAGGSLTAAFGILLALYRRNKNGGEGSIIDVSMVEGASYLGTFINVYKDMDLLWNGDHAVFSGGCPVYRTYTTSDDKHIAIGALEKKFSSQLFDALGLDYKEEDLYRKPLEVTKHLEKVFKDKTRDEWCQVFEGIDVCATPVLEIEEVGEAKHHKQRGTFIRDGNNWIPRPAPKIYTVEEFSQLLNKVQSN